MTKALQMKKNKFDRAFDQLISETALRRKDNFEPYAESFRRKMSAFRRALQSEGVELPQEKYFVSDGLAYSSE